MSIAEHVGTDVWEHIASFLPSYGDNGAHRLLHVSKDLVSREFHVDLRRQTLIQLFDMVVNRHHRMKYTSRSSLVAFIALLGTRRRKREFEIETIDELKHVLDTERREFDMRPVSNVNLPLMMLTPTDFQDIRIFYHMRSTPWRLHVDRSGDPDMSVMEWYDFSTKRHERILAEGFAWSTRQECYIRPEPGQPWWSMARRDGMHVSFLIKENDVWTYFNLEDYYTMPKEWLNLRTRDGKLVVFRDEHRLLVHMMTLDPATGNRDPRVRIQMKKFDVGAPLVNEPWEWLANGWHGDKRHFIVVRDQTLLAVVAPDERTANRAFRLLSHLLIKYDANQWLWCKPDARTVCSVFRYYNRKHSNDARYTGQKRELLPVTHKTQRSDPTRYTKGQRMRKR